MRASAFICHDCIVIVVGGDVVTIAVSDVVVNDASVVTTTTPILRSGDDGGAHIGASVQACTSAPAFADARIQGVRCRGQCSVTIGNVHVSAGIESKGFLE